MRILLDECVPRPFKRELRGHNVRTVAEMGWAGKSNGELLQLMLPQKFDAFLTIDQNLQYQQNLRQAGVSVIVMSAGNNRISDLIPLVPKVLAALGSVKAGELMEVRP